MQIRSNKKKYIYLQYIGNKIKLSYFKISIIKFILFIYFFLLTFKNERKQIKIALCTMGKKENLYVKEFVDYYIKFGIDSIFIYDDNDEESEKISNVIDSNYKNYVKIYDTKNNQIFNQSDAFTDCYHKNKNIYNWILMIDMDEYLYIKYDNLKNYLMKPIFNKCDFIKFHWVHPTDNNHLHYENKSLFERFKGPYKNSNFVKSIVKGNIKGLKYWVHSPYISPIKNISCNNIGKIINNKDINIEYIDNINIKKAFIIHFDFKSTEEFINKYKRGYSNWFGDKLNNFLNNKIRSYFIYNEITKEKINYFEKELNIDLNDYKNNLK